MVAKDYPAWKAPNEDGQTLIWPAPSEILRHTRKNQQALAECGALVQNVPVSELRREIRAEIGHAENARPILASGHQTELYHPGVWAKDCLAKAAADVLSGSAIHFAVDTDTPKHLSLRWPGYSEAITDDPAVGSANWTSLLSSSSEAHLNRIESALARSRFAQPPVLMEFLGDLRKHCRRSSKLTDALTGATRELNLSLSLDHRMVLGSELWGCQSYLVFVHHLVARAGEFAGQYNAALSQFRRDKRVHSPARPMPDLQSNESACEIPFWLDFLRSAQRVRPSVSFDTGGTRLFLPGHADFFFEKSADGHIAAERLYRFLAANGVRLAPRALTLTMFLRLAVVDNFIHGIGGGRYDQITDRLFEKHFEIEPPRFCVTTATMLLPEALGRTRVCLPCMKSEGHRLRHSLLGERKGEMLKAIESAPRGSLPRRQLFGQIHQELAQIAASSSALARWNEQYKAAQKQEIEDGVLFDRELFFALQPRPRLMQMVDRYRQVFN